MNELLGSEILQETIIKYFVLGGEQAAEVSDSLMVGRDMVYQTAKRMKERLKGIVQKLLAVGAA